MWFLRLLIWSGLRLVEDSLVLGAVIIRWRVGPRITPRRMREIRRASRRAAVEISRKLQSALKAAAPVRTGKLKRSIRTSAVRNIGRRIEIGAGARVHVRMRFYGWIQNAESGDRRIRHSGWIDNVVARVATPAHYAAATRRHLRWG